MKSIKYTRISTAVQLMLFPTLSWQPRDRTFGSPAFYPSHTGSQRGQMKNLNNLKGYTKSQRQLAYSIRNATTSKLVLSNTQENRLYERVMAITSPMFFIRYRELLEAGKIAEALSKYQDDNYKRKAKFMTNR